MIRYDADSDPLALPLHSAQLESLPQYHADTSKSARNGNPDNWQKLLLQHLLKPNAAAALGDSRQPAPMVINSTAANTPRTA